jgi:hypothetical protein
VIKVQRGELISEKCSNFLSAFVSVSAIFLVAKRYGNCCFKKSNKSGKNFFYSSFLRKDIFSNRYRCDLSNTEFGGKRIDPLIVLVFYTKSVFIAESGGNIHCASRFESFKH